MQIIIDVIKQILSIILLAEKQKMRTFAMENFANEDL